ncbi:MAG: molybdenum cofactor guanylyltransferase [Gammaproteobacteria bacterium]|nr:molybdenum cofactor guanylyltransferase [Gammaproteobacteria bacterium]
MTIHIATQKITGVILAGGRARRMDGQDKGLIRVNNQPMIRLIIDQLTPQVANILINANRNLEEYKSFNYPVISDQDASDFNGPLAGMLSAMRACDCDYILSVPCDGPFLPADLSTRLYRELSAHDADICVVHDGERMQPVFALIKTELADSLQQFLDNGDRKIDLWYQQHKTVLADFSDDKNISLNINTPEELIKLEQQLSETPAC